MPYRDTLLYLIELFGAVVSLAVVIELWDHVGGLKGFGYWSLTAIADIRHRMERRTIL